MSLQQVTYRLRDDVKLLMFRMPRVVFRPLVDLLWNTCAMKVYEARMTA